MTEIPKGRPVKKSHIIAAVLVIIAVLILASIFYTLIEGRTGCPCTKAPIGLIQQNRTENSVTLLAESVPEGAEIDGMTIILDHNGTLEQIISADIYAPDGTPVAIYRNNTGYWLYFNNSTDTHSWENGMILEVHVSSVHEGDLLTISSTPYTFGTTTIMISD